MFTGIIEQLGTAVGLEKNRLSAVLFVEPDNVIQNVLAGESIAIDGACLTVVEYDKNVLKFDVSSETMEKTLVKELKPGYKVNLERALKAGSRIGGHFVTGHIDCVSKIKQKYSAQNTTYMEIEIQQKFLHYIVNKGSAAVDGISLTIAKISQGSFGVYVIPHTLKNTTLHFKNKNDYVNIEFDILSKYIESSVNKHKKSNITVEFLNKNGFI